MKFPNSQYFIHWFLSISNIKRDQQLEELLYTDVSMTKNKTNLKARTNSSLNDPSTCTGAGSMKVVGMLPGISPCTLTLHQNGKKCALRGITYCFHLGPLSSMPFAHLLLPKSQVSESQHSEGYCLDDSQWKETQKAIDSVFSVYLCFLGGMNQHPSLR